MSVDSSTARVTYTGDNTTPDYAIPFKFLAKADLEVIRADTDGAETTLALTTDYTIPDDDVGDAAGGTLTLVAGNLATGYKLTIRRNCSLLQSTDLHSQSSYSPKVVEDALDRQVMISQQLQEQIDRCIKLPPTDPGTSYTTKLGTQANRASERVQFDSSGNATTATTDSSAALSASGFMQTVLDDSDAATARTTLGFSGTGGKVVHANLDADTINGATAETAPASGDFALIYDLTATALRKMTLANLMNNASVRCTAVRVYTSSDTWSKPTGLQYVIAETVGGGGGGGGVAGDAAEASAAGGGGGGGYAKGRIAAASLGSTEAVTIGAAGTAGAAGLNNGGNGGNSSFGAHVTGAGGTGGTGGDSVTASAAVAGGAGGAGAGSGDDYNVTGQTGQAGYTVTSIAAIPGAGGDSMLGKGGRSATQNGAGAAGTGYGAGGSGAAALNDNTDRAGAAGTAGLVIVYEFTSL